MARRYDRPGKFSRVDATPQGGLAIPAYLTRTGVFTYVKADGSKTRELRHPDEVFKPEALDSLKGAPLTIGHPGMVTPERYRDLNVGHVGDDVRKDDRFVAATVRIQDAKAVAGVNDGSLIELSCGYTADVVQGAGVYDGEAFDSVQKNLRYNHVAIIGPNEGRAGNEVALRLDSGDVAYEHADSSTYASSSMTPEQLAALQAAHQIALAQVAALQAEAKVRQDHATELATVTGANKALTAKVEELTAALATANKAHADSASPAALDALVAKRTETIAKARGLAGEKFDGTGKTDAQIMREALAVAQPDVKYDSDAEVAGAFKALAKTSADATKARGAVLEAGAGLQGGQRADADDDDPLEKARTAQNTYQPKNKGA